MTTPQTLTVTECHYLLDSLLSKKGTKTQFRKGIRNYLITLLMLDAGLRVGEVVKLQISDLWFVEHPLKAIAINSELAEKNCERIIPVGTRLHLAIEEMYKCWWNGVGISTHSWAFISSEGTHPITTRQIERIIRAAGMKFLGRPVHPHMLRHTFASRLMRKTNMRIVQELLGHKNISSTQIYTHPNGDDLSNAILSIEEHNSLHETHTNPLPPDTCVT